MEPLINSLTSTLLLKEFLCIKIIYLIGIITVVWYQRLLVRNLCMLLVYFRLFPIVYCSLPLLSFLIPTGVLTRSDASIILETVTTNSSAFVDYTILACTAFFFCARITFCTCYTISALDVTNFDV